jgi:hypothetical protein
MYLDEPDVALTHAALRVGTVTVSVAGSEGSEGSEGGFARCGGPAASGG